MKTFAAEKMKRVAALTGETVASTHAAPRVSRTLTQAVTSLLGADLSGVVVAHRGSRDDPWEAKAAIVQTAVDPRVLTLVDVWCRDLHARDEYFNAVCDEPDGGVFPRQKYFNPRQWNKLVINRVRFEAGLDEALVSAVHISEHTRVHVAVNRTRGADAFRAEEVATLDALTTGIAPFLRRLADETLNAPPTLSPAVQRVYEFLLTGIAQGEIAERLGISRHTVHEHVHTIYRKHGVRSRAELLARRIAAG
jgi:DNA-binding CsgD family transcriptional regulator